jgi:hypothetical protein
VSGDGVDEAPSSLQAASAHTATNTDARKGAVEGFILLPRFVAVFRSS